MGWVTIKGKHVLIGGDSDVAGKDHYRKTKAAIEKPKASMTMERAAQEHAAAWKKYERSPQYAKDLAASKAKRAALDRKYGVKPGQGFDAFTLYGKKGKK